MSARSERSEPRSEVHVVLPHNIDDPAAPSGGNIYDRRICRGLAALGWSVREHVVPGGWPRPATAERATLARVLGALPDGALVLLDGLVASAAADVLVPQGERLRLVALVHLPLADSAEDAAPADSTEDATLADSAEGAALAAARAVVTTSDWTRQRLLDLYRLPAHRVHVAPPGVDPAPVTPASAAGGRLLCVAAVTRHKGYDVLVRALAAVADTPWSCVCVGPLDRDPGFVDRVRGQIEGYRLDDRIRLVGPRTASRLDASYAAADLLVLASRGETYGMVVTEALARGIPVLASAANGLPEALGRAPDGSTPGMLVPPDDAGALAAALRRWLDDTGLRYRLRRSARARRSTLTGWAVTAELVSTALERVPAARGEPR